VDALSDFHPHRRMTLPDFGDAQVSLTPFPTMKVPAVLPAALAGTLLQWFEGQAPWSLKETDFYEQHEFSLLGTSLPSSLAALTSESFVSSVASGLKDAFSVSGQLELTEVAAHRLQAGQTIRIHNDYLAGDETHRLLIQLNSGWVAENGGLLMLFSGDRPEDVTDIILPRSGSGFAFEISARSYHAVSTIRAGRRYTLVYTFRRAS
jgi:Rps23 Pro-64 3,4-dihydroxylase Tpa1-like proline 4-hydroxylase